MRWQAKINLVAPASMPELWTRHMADSLQVQAAVPSARRWVDFGSGGGFPGVVTAIVIAGAPDASVQLVESDKRKAAFLRAVSRETGAPARIHAERIETFASVYADPVDAVSARALARLPQLVRFAERFLLSGATGVFPKGQRADAELTESQRDHRFVFSSVPSRTNDQAALLIVRAVGAGAR